MANLIPLLLVTLALTLTSLVDETNSAKILSISFMSSKSHKIVYEPLLYKLAERGHQLTIVTPIKSTKEETKNVRIFDVIPLEEFEKELSMPNFFEMKQSESNLFDGLIKFLVNGFIIMGNFMENICRKQYQLPIIKQILEEHEKEPFDLVLLTPFFNECLYGLVHKMNTTNVLISQVPVFPWIAATFGNPALPSFVPTGFNFNFSDRMTLGERLVNFLSTVYNNVAKACFYDAKAEKAYRDFFGDQSMPSIKEIEANASLVLANAHVAISSPRPLLPDVVNVGGMNMVPAQPLPKNLEEFLADTDKDGFILFSMGSALKGHTIPEGHRKLLLETFGRLKQKVLWKWETETMEGVPKNVKLSKWLPQQDLLGHKNIRMFITHGGHGSTTESLYHGVPLIGIPIFGDQKSNMAQAERLGYSIPLDFNDLVLDRDLLFRSINKILNDPSYRQNVQRLSAIYKDDMNHPLERAAWNVEYVLRHGGARHLQSSARDLSVIQYYSIDVLLILAAIGLISTYINFIVLRALYRKCFGKKDQAPSPSQKRTKKVQ